MNNIAIFLQISDNILKDRFLFFSRIVPIE